jgi:F-type H+-transporting ATPase subunit delta
MSETKHNSPTAISYAQSLLELATERKQAEAVGQELAGIGEIIEQTPSFSQFLMDPAISQDERAAFIQKVFAGRVSQLVLNFLGVLNVKNRAGILGQIVDAYQDLLDEQLGKIEVDVTVAQKLTPEQLETVRQKVSQALKKDAVVHQYVDESIIGGLVLRVQDQLIDASVRYQLEAMRGQLLAARPK